MKQLQLVDSGSPLKKAKQQLDSLLKSPQAVGIIKFSLLMLIISWIEYGVFYRYLPPEIPLLFSKPWGSEQLVNKGFLIAIPTAITCLFIINIHFSSVLLKKNKLHALILLWGQLLGSVLGLVTMNQI